MPYCFVRPHRQIAQQNLGTRCAQCGLHICRFEIDGTEGGIVGIIGHVPCNAIEYRTHLNDDVRHRQGALKDAGAVWLCEDRLLERVTDFAPVYVKPRDKFDIATAITTDFWAPYPL